MMSFEELVQLFRENAGQEILSAYLPARTRDPAMRAETRTLFNAGVTRLRKSLDDAAREHRDAFDSAAQHARDALDGDERPAEGEGLALFAAPDGVRHMGALHAPAPVTIEWRAGIVVAPYLRSLKHAHPALLALVDSRAARLYRYQAAALEPLASLEADQVEEEPSRLGEVPAGPFHHGTRGGTATDEIARREHAATERLLADTVARLQGVATPESWIVIGGIARHANDLMAALPKALAPRAHLATYLTMQASHPELLTAVADETSALTRAADAALVDAVLDRAAAGARGAAGWAACARALDARAVHQVLVSATAIDQHLGRVEDAVRRALDGGALVEVVSGPGAERLDAMAEGIAASLRFPVPETSTGVHEAAVNR